MSNYTQARAQQLGFDYYQWVTSQDERVSIGMGGHKYLNGRIYKYSEPTAKIDAYSNCGHPGQRINCRCTQVSIIPAPNQEFKKVKDAVSGDYYILVEKE